MWSPDSTTVLGGCQSSIESRLWKIASAVPRYHLPTETWCGGLQVIHCSRRRGRKFQPKRMCSSSERAWYCVSRWMRRRPEWMQLLSVKSMMR